MIVKLLLSGLIELIYPPDIYCICCGAVIGGNPYAICGNCRDSIVWTNSRTCVKCGKALQDWYVLDTCMDCKQTEHYYQKGYVCVSYDMLSRTPVHNLKYNGKGYIARNIGLIMADKLVSAEKRAESYDLIVPVPMHRHKQKKRGYNQAGLIAGQLSRQINVPCEEKLLIRTKRTEAMSKLSADERRRNMLDAFQITDAEKVRSKKVLLVDDVYTTGSTADGCAEKLLGAGAAKIDVITFAAGQNVFKNQNQY